MFANRFTAFIDACSLADTLRRNLLLTLAEAEFFRLRWSATVLDETQVAIEKIRSAKGYSDAAEKAQKSRMQMEDAFEDAMVSEFSHFLPSCDKLPDAKDAHVLAAALKTQASIIVTENLKDFPVLILEALNLEARSSDAFIADTIALDPGRAIVSIRAMRQRLNRPEITPEGLLLEMEARGLIEAVNVMKPYSALL